MRNNVIKWLRASTAITDLRAVSGAPMKRPAVVEFINDNAVAATVTLVSASGSSVAFLTPAVTQLMVNMSPASCSFSGGAATFGWRVSPVVPTNP